MADWMHCKGESGKELACDKLAMVRAASAVVMATEVDEDRDDLEGFLAFGARSLTIFGLSSTNSFFFSS